MAVNRETASDDMVSLDHLRLMRKRLELLVGGRIVHREKMAEAGKAIDQLRRKVEGWSSVEQIRRWRDR